MLGVRGDQVGVDHRENLRQHLQHRDLGAERREHRRELHPDHTAADDRKAGRNFFELEDAVGVDRELGAFQRDARDGRAGRDDDVFGRDRLAIDRDLALARQTRGAV